MSLIKKMPQCKQIQVQNIRRMSYNVPTIHFNANTEQYRTTSLF